jgi:hypothetical protein
MREDEEKARKKKPKRGDANISPESQRKKDDATKDRLESYDNGLKKGGASAMTALKALFAS